MPNTDTIFDAGTGKYLELDLFTEKIQQMHGEGKIAFARTKNGVTVIKDLNEKIHTNVLVKEAV